MTTTTDPAAERALLRARLDKFQTVDAFIDGFHRFFARGGVLLPTRQPREVGSRVTLQLEIAGGTIVLLAEGVVDSVRADKENRSPGMVIRFTHIEPPYRATVERILALRNEKTGSFEAVLTNREEAAATSTPVEREEVSPIAAAEVSAETPTVRDAAPVVLPASESSVGAAAPTPGWAAVPVAAGEGGLAGDDFDALVDSIDDSFDAIFGSASTRPTTPSPAVVAPPVVDAPVAGDDEDAEHPDRPSASKTVFGLRAFDPNEGLAALRQQAAEMSATAATTPDEEGDEEETGDRTPRGGIRTGAATPPGSAAATHTPPGGSLRIDQDREDERQDLLAGFADNAAPTTGGPVASKTVMGIPALGAVPRPQRVESTEGSEPTLDISGPNDPALGDVEDASSSQPLGRIQFNRVSRNELEEKRATTPVDGMKSAESDPFDDDELPAERVKPRPMTAILQSLQEADEPLPSPDDALQRLASPTPAGTAALSNDRANSALDDLVSDAAPSAVAAAATPDTATSLPISTRDAATDISWSEKKPGLIARFLKWLRGLFGG